MGKFTDSKKAAKLEQDEEEFFDAAPVAEIGEVLIPKWHEHLRTARILYLFTNKQMVEKGKVVFGKTKKSPPLVSYLGECDFYVITSFMEWQTMSSPQREAYVDHELCHCSYKISEAGQHSWRERPHDIEEFPEIVERHGLWSNSVARFAEVIQQLELFPAKKKATRKPRK